MAEIEITLPTVRKVGRPATKADIWSDLFAEQGEGCWEWPRTDSHGYGYVSIKNKRTKTHILSFKLSHGREPEGVVRHDCDNRACYRPGHLLEGTNKQNSEDMVARDRHHRGQRNGNSRLLASQVLEIRERHGSGESQSGLAREFGVGLTTVHNIITRKTWNDERNFA